MKVEFITKTDLEKFKKELLSEIRKSNQVNPTPENLQLFKEELLADIRRVLKAQPEKIKDKEWLKAYEVRKLLGISNGTLQNMRINGTITFSRIGGLTFYRYEDIVKLMEENKYQNPLIGKFRTNK